MLGCLDEQQRGLQDALCSNGVRLADVVPNESTSRHTVVTAIICDLTACWQQGKIVRKAL